MYPIWKFLPAGLAHELAPIGIQLYSEIFPCQKADWLPLDWHNLHFRNRAGTAGGVDKNAELLEAWQSLGAGFCEIGTVTPLPQNPNSGKIIDRDWENQNLWNKMGFPSHGMKDVYHNILHHKKNINIPLFINIGKNRDTPNLLAHHDYIDLVKQFKNVADVFVVNISSPNTKNLRDLQNQEYLKFLCHQVTHTAGHVPVVIKLSPDLSEAELCNAMDTALSECVSGFILTNTTTSRPSGCVFPTEGGLSGKDLKSKSIKALQTAIKHLGNNKKNTLIVSAGGILTSDDIKHRLDLGADLTQSYSGLIFEGPHFFKKASQFFNKKGNP